MGMEETATLAAEGEGMHSEGEWLRVDGVTWWHGTIPAQPEKSTLSLRRRFIRWLEKIA
jgi:hypothetical protein